MVLESSYNYAGGRKDTEDRGGRGFGGNEPLLKLLVPNYVAGALIGKGGTLLNEIKQTYGGNIRISGGKENYPGTDERVVVITGKINQIIDINNHVMEKVQDPGRDSTMKNVSIDESRAKTVKIVLTNGAAGLLIGRSGATIKAIQEESKARISVGMPDKASVPGERVVTMTGSFDERTDACRKIIEKVAEEASNMANTKSKYYNTTLTPNDMYAATTAPYAYDTAPMASPFNNRQQLDNRNQFSVLSGNAMSAFRSNTNMTPPPYQIHNKLKAKVEVLVDVPDVLVGGVMGKQGSIIKDFVQRSGGAKFRFSDKTDDADRTLTITGDMDQAQMAYNLVCERVEQLKSQANLQRY